MTTDGFFGRAALTRAFPWTHRLARRVVLVLFVLSVGCTRVPPLRQYDDHTNKQCDEAPLVVVGLAEGDERVGQPVPARDDPSYSRQLHRAKVHVENVLKGAIAEHTIQAYYFAVTGGIDGTWPLSLAGKSSRRVFWLRKDRGVYRLACDAWIDCTVPIVSGAHPGYKPDPGESFDQVLIDLILTRGEGQVDNHQFAKGLGRGLRGQGLQGYTIEKLRHLALTESSEVKYTACQLLWSNSLDERDDRLRQRAEDSVRTAGCTCGFDPSRAVVCQ